ncbi:N-acyl-D-amino-acid deacylase [Fodinibius roseus]|uniref:N-acyl-D-amino-acid deacylase n=1 Tax=Fodinibius roseus TaxID=1194090 RepID=A0A1M4TD29_9BACT|nr:amidohydrolase family protein [Fodinibius roseus]SHE42412.1 N-acyl-D-amino-acid deacylase [Fodinibius roseus]
MVVYRTLFVLASIFIGLVISKPALAQDTWDWHISGGTVVDGSGRESYEADILISGDQISFVGEVDPDTIRVQNRVDASDHIVSPGFIDPHAHGNPLETPEFRNFLAMGVTTVVLGQDGSSPSVGSLDAWCAKVADIRPAVNIAVLSGHGSIRNKAGVGKKYPTERELQEMEQLLKADLAAGAFGMSTGLEYVPGLYAGQEELEQLAEVVGAEDGIIMSHMRSEDDAEIEASLDELAGPGKYTDVHVSHLKVVYGKGADRAGEILDYMEGFRKRGIRISADLYPYSASYTGIGIVFPDWAKTNEEWKNALLERPEALRSYLTDKVARRNGPAAILFGSGKYAGRTLKEAARQQGLSPVDLLLEMGPRSASAAHFVMDQELQDHLVTGNRVMISSDGSPTMRHPRGYGSFAKVIRYYVKEKEMLSLEEAIHKMSGLPARTVGLTGRGTIASGHKADLLIFNPEKVGDRATFENPHREAEGFDWIMINGQVVREGGTFRDKRRGRVLSKSLR